DRVLIFQNRLIVLPQSVVEPAQPVSIFTFLHRVGKIGRPVRPQPLQRLGKIAAIVQQSRLQQHLIRPSAAPRFLERLPVGIRLARSLLQNKPSAAIRPGYLAIEIIAPSELLQDILHIEPPLEPLQEPRQVKSSIGLEMVQTSIAQRSEEHTSELQSL